MIKTKERIIDKFDDYIKVLQRLCDINEENNFAWNLIESLYITTDKKILKKVYDALILVAG